MGHVSSTEEIFNKLNIFERRTSYEKDSFVSVRLLTPESMDESAFDGALLGNAVLRNTHGGIR